MEWIENDDRKDILRTIRRAVVMVYEWHDVVCHRRRRGGGCVGLVIRQLVHCRVRYEQFERIQNEKGGARRIAARGNEGTGLGVFGTSNVGHRGGASTIVCFFGSRLAECYRTLRLLPLAFESRAPITDLAACPIQLLPGLYKVYVC